MKTHIDRQIGCSVFGVSLIGRPPAQVRASISAIQDAIEAALPRDIAYRTPAASLHLSIFQFVSVRDMNHNGSTDWEVHQDKVTSALGAIVSDSWNISLSAPRLELRPAAIILVFPPSSGLEWLRDRIERSPSLSVLNSRRPELQHVSLFRYSKERLLEPLRSACQEIDCGVPEWCMTQMDLVRETVYPSLHLELLRSFRATETFDDAGGRVS